VLRALLPVGNPPPLSLLRQMFDMFVGGVSAAGEPAHLTAQRELAEELGIHANSQASPPLSHPLAAAADERPTSGLTYLFDASVSTPLNRCRVAVFRCNCALPVSPSGAGGLAAEPAKECPESGSAGIRFQASEVQGGRWEPRASVAAAADASWAAHVLGGSRSDGAGGEAATAEGEAASGPAPIPAPVREFVPDGLAVWNAFLEWEAMQPLAASVLAAKR
jgi:hypothetical protein